MLEDTTLIITAAQLLANVTDADSSTLTITSVTAGQGTLIDNGNGTWSYTPPANYNGVMNLAYTVSDGLIQVQQNINITVQDVADPGSGLQFVFNNQSVENPDYLNADENYVLDDPTRNFTLKGSDMSTDDIANSVRIQVKDFGEANDRVDLLEGNVKNVLAHSDTNANVDIFDFKRADVNLGDGGNSDVWIKDAQRGDIVTGSGADTINLEVQENQDSLSNTFNINTGAGDDTLNLRGDDSGNNDDDDHGGDNDHDDDDHGNCDDNDDQVNSQTIFNVATGDGNDTVTVNGSYLAANIDTGAGNDTIYSGSDNDTIEAGTGNDTIYANSGNDSIKAGFGNDYIDAGSESDTVTFKGSRDQYTVEYQNGHYIITDLTSGRDGVDTVKGAESFVFSDGSYSGSELLASEANNAPIVGAPNSYTMNEDSGYLTITSSSLLSNSSDSDGDTLTVTNVTVPTAQGSIDIDGNGNWKFTPASNFNGVANLTFTVSDGSVSVAQTAMVNVASVNDAPIVNAPAAFNMSEDGSLIISKSQLLANASDVDGDILSISNISVPSAQGSLSSNGNGTWTFNPAANFNGSVVVSFTTTDGLANVNKSATVMVAAVNDAPILGNVTLNTNEDQTIVISAQDLLSSATDLEGNTLTITNVTSTQGVLVNNFDGTWSYTPPANFNGVVSLRYTVSDGSLLSSKDAIVNVGAVNDAPVAQAYSVNMDENTAIVISAAQIISYVADVDGDNLSISNLSAAQGTLVNNGNGTWSFTPPSNFNGNLQLNYTVSDGLISVQQSINVAVQNVSDSGLQFVLNDTNVENPNYVNPNVNYVLDDPTQNFTLQGSQMDTDYISSNVRVQVKDYGEANDRLDLNQGEVKNVLAHSDTNANVDLIDFIRADVNLGGNGDSDVWIKDAQRGDIVTGSGDDDIKIEVQGDQDNLSDKFDINSGAGDDKIDIMGSDVNSIFDIQMGSGDNFLSLQGKYGSADIFGGGGDDQIYAGIGNDVYHFGEGQGQDFYDAGAGTGWADTIMLDSNSDVSITQVDECSWTLIVDGQEASLTTNATGVVVDNRLDFEGSANGTLIMADGSKLDFNNVEHLEW